MMFALGSRVGENCFISILDLTNYRRRIALFTFHVNCYILFTLKEPVILASIWQNSLNLV